MQNVRIQDDLFEAVNGKWLETAVIPNDKPVTGGFSTLDENVEKIMMSDLEKFSKGEKEVNVDTLDKAVKLYQKVLDEEKRNSEGINPILPLLHKIQSISSIEQLNENSKELLLDGVVLPLSVHIETDMKDADKNAFMVYGPSIILPDTTYYGEDNQTGKSLMEVYKNMASSVLKYTDLTKQQQKQYLDDAIYYDSLIAQKVKSQLEWADYVNNYNPYSVKDVEKYSSLFSVKKLLDDIYGQDKVETVIVADPKAIEEMSFYFNENNFSKYIHWSYIKTLLANCKYLSTELATLANSYRRALMGVETDPTLEKQAYKLVSQVFADPMGIYYGREYFGEEAKKDIHEIVDMILATWKKRVSNNQFLQEKTKEKALLKLSTIKTKLGYPDKVDEIYYKYEVNDEDNLYQAMRKIERVDDNEALQKLFKPVNKDEWLMPGHMVNACYDPNRNDITFPAAILQAPFYSINQTISENLGGIGAVISHEVSHAFDNNGAHFDEKGNIDDWWSESDYQNFQQLTDKMTKQWDGIDYAGGKVNGQLVVSENIADNGGMAVTIDIMHSIENSDFQQYFQNWAKIWCQKSTDQYKKYLLVNDVHSPAKLRANIQVRNFKEWYQAFDVKETDQMYLPEEERLIIW